MVRLHKFIFSKNFSRKIFRNFHKIIFSPFCRLIKSLFILRPLFYRSTFHKKFLNIWNRFCVKNSKLLSQKMDQSKNDSLFLPFLRAHTINLHTLGPNAKKKEIFYERERECLQREIRLFKILATLLELFQYHFVPFLLRTTSSISSQRFSRIEGYTPLYFFQVDSDLAMKKSQRDHLGRFSALEKF